MTGDKTPGASAKLRTLSDLCTPWCIHVVATLRIADHIAAGTTDIKTLAEEAGCDPDSLLRVLRYLVDKGVFQQPAPGRFALNEAALELLDPSMQLGLDLGGIGGRMAHGLCVGEPPQRRPHGHFRLPRVVRPALLGGPGSASGHRGEL